MYNTQHISQAFFQNFSNYITLAPGFARDAMKYLTAMTKTEFRLLALILKLAHNYKKLRIAQETLARYLGVCRKTINEYLQRLEWWGLIDSRGHLYDTRTYRVNSWFLVPSVRTMFLFLFPALGVAIPQIKIQKVTPYRNISLFINSSNLTTSKYVATKKENILQVVRVSSIKERREIMKPINEVFGEDMVDPKDHAELYHRTNPRKTTSYSSQTNQRGEDQEYPTKGNRFSNSSDVNNHYAKQIEDTKRLTESFKPVAITFEEAMKEITRLEQYAADPQTQAAKKLMGIEGFNAWLKSQCDRVLSRVDFDKK